ncbi:MAG: hypothetical protein AAF074_14735 [Pseudomonadota bacterium]
MSTAAVRAGRSPAGAGQRALTRLIAATLFALAVAVPGKAGAGTGEHADLPAAFKIDCTFFESQAFNRPEGHFTVKMAAICAMLSDYKSAVIDANRRRFRGERDATSPAMHAKNRSHPLPAGSDTGKYLLAKSLGLIDAMAEPMSGTIAAADESTVRPK